MTETSAIDDKNYSSFVVYLSVIVDFNEAIGHVSVCLYREHIFPALSTVCYINDGCFQTFTKIWLFLKYHDAQYVFFGRGCVG